jgi:4-carboxymuconolactone decarboxylase
MSESIEESLGGIAAGDAPVLEQLTQMTLNTLERSGLDEETYILTRLAALVAMDAPPVSYLLNLGAADDAGVSLDRIQGTLVAIAPIVGTARVVSAAGKTLRALGLAEAIVEADDLD